MTSTSVFVDMENLNVLFKTRDKFVAAMSFSNSIDRLFQLLPSLGIGYDVYLCFKPRAIGEGNCVINDLSTSGVPFTCDKDELLGCINLFAQQRGVGSVFVCNWLENYATWARVPDCKSVIYYGNRVALVEIESKMTCSMRMFSSVKEFTETSGLSDNESKLYGDNGLLDVNGILARYPEFNSVSKTQLTMLIPLIACNNTNCKMRSYEVIEAINVSSANNVVSDVEVTVEAPTIDEDATTSGSSGLGSAPVPITPEMPKKKRKGHKISAVTKIAATLCCFGSLLFGFTFGTVSNCNSKVPDEATVEAQLEEMKLMSYAVETLNQATQWSENRNNFIQNVRNICPSVTVTGYEYLDGSQILYCQSSEDCISMLANGFSALGETVTCLETGSTVNEVGESVITFSLTLL